MSNMEKTIINWSLKDVRLWSKIVFEVEEHWVFKQFSWLENFVRIWKIVIVDNHHEVLPFWDQNLPVIHIDQHTDMRPVELEGVNVGNFLTYALEKKIIPEVFQVTTEYKILNTDFSSLYVNGFILDVDLDFWHPDMSIEQYKKTISITKELIYRAKIVTIATSPYFLDQHLALQILGDLLHE